jgi:hypothetical protein
MMGGEAAGAAAGEGEIGVGGQQTGGFRKFSEKQGLLDAFGTAQGDHGVGVL